MTIPVTVDPYAGRDARTRLMNGSHGLERVEPVARRFLLTVAVVALLIGLSTWLSGNASKSPLPVTSAASAMR